MVIPSQQTSENAQRIQVELQPTIFGKQVTIRLESHDEGLGWYSSGSLVLPLHQLPLLEQALASMRQESAQTEYAEIIPFPGS